METVLITGANRGIGLELARHYAAQNWQVIGVCRESSDELDAIASRVISGIDLTDIASVNTLKQTLSGQTLHLLINNAGLLQDEQLGHIDFDTIQQQMEINAYAPLRVTEALLSHLVDGSKIINITSRMGSIADNSSGGRYGYRASKAALNAFSKSLAVDLKPKGIAVALLHPGYVQTRMVNYEGLISPADSASALAKRIDELTLETTGTFWHSNGDILPW